MKKVIAAKQVVSARASDTGDEIRLVLLDEAGDESVVMLPLDQLAILASWLEQARRLSNPDPAQPSAPGATPQPVMAIERWSVRPEADEENLTMVFKLAQGMEIALSMHRRGAGTFAKALNSLLGRMLPAPQSKARH